MTHGALRGARNHSLDHGLCQWTTADEQLSACTCSKRELRTDGNRRPSRMSKVGRELRSPPPPTPPFELPPSQLEALSSTRPLLAGPPLPSSPDLHRDRNNEATKSLFPFTVNFNQSAGEQCVQLLKKVQWSDLKDVSWCERRRHFEVVFV